MSTIPAPVKHIIFDVDGVLVNTFPSSSRAALKVLKNLGINADLDEIIPYIGTGEENFILGPCKKYGRIEVFEQGLQDFYNLFSEFISTDISVFDSVHYVLDALAKSPIHLAVASSSSRNKLEKTLSAAKIDATIFDVIISGSDVKERKPSPEIYLTAMEKLGAKPCECLVIEDAVSGVISAKAAGCTCFAVTNSFSKQSLLEAGADITATSIAELLD